LIVSVRFFVDVDIDETMHLFRTDQPGLQARELVFKVLDGLCYRVAFGENCLFPIGQRAQQCGNDH